MQLMDNVTEISKLGKKILLGSVHSTFDLPGGKKLDIKRMPMSAEIRFIEVYNGLIEKLQSTRQDVFDKIRAYMEGSKAVNFGLMEGLQMLGDVMGQLPVVQAALIEGVLILAGLQNATLDADYIKENLSTADCLEILGAQSEVQGLLGSFRGILAGLSATSDRG
jgi:hypothetical protein